ncbi:hypothetical protein [Agrobacterium sp. LAD9]|uniref:hypothetical protein n=1 Tax=Agrobacterium sp. LAD9 TaxID=2055153 RepID=UPI000D1F2237|nr:hypothetical protein [Agrobacterium sp. LAD9]
MHLTAKAQLFFLGFFFVSTAFAQNGHATEANLDVGIPSGRGMVCQFDQRVKASSKKRKITEQVEYFSIITGKSAQLCDGEGRSDDEDLSCQRFEFVGRNEGGSIVFVSESGLKLTTNLLALALGAGIEINDLKGKVSTAYTGRCHEGDLRLIKKGLPGYEE